MHKNLTITSVLGILAVALGAFGAHALKNKLSVDGLNSFETAVRYQMYHVLVLLFVHTYQGFSARTKNSISILFFIGIVLFSGSIYVIQLTMVTAKSIWFITPLGGLFLILGWGAMSWSFAKKKSTINS